VYHVRMKSSRRVACIIASGLFFKPFQAVAGMKPALRAPEMIVVQARGNPAVLPQRNLQIEIRQLGTESAERSTVDAQGRVLVQPGQTRAQANVTIDHNRSQQSRKLLQQAMVLNGRSVSFTLGHTLPMRVVQVLVYKDALHMVPTSVLIDHQSGFSARPLWYGEEVAEVEISATLAQGSRSSKVSTTLPIQMNEWITIAQAEDARNGGIGGVLSRSNEQAQSSLHLEMRVTVK
jgi:hypothetical protein